MSLSAKQVVALAKKFRTRAAGARAESSHFKGQAGALLDGIASACEWAATELEQPEASIELNRHGCTADGSETP